MQESRPSANRSPIRASTITAFQRLLSPGGHAQIDLFCTAFAITLHELLPAHNGGYLRGHTKSQVTVRDE
jgi:hypothetical protein